MQTALKSYTVALVLRPTRVPAWSIHSVLSTSFMAQLVPSLRGHVALCPQAYCRGIYTPTSLPTNLYPKRMHSKPRAPTRRFQYSNQQFSKCGQGPKAKTINIFSITLSQYLPLSLSFCHGCTVEFSGGSVTCDDITDLMVMDCVLIYFALKTSRFQFLRH